MKIELQLPVGYDPNRHKKIDEAIAKNRERAERISKGYVKVTIEAYPFTCSRKEMNYFHMLCRRLATQAGDASRWEYIKEEAKNLALDWGYPPEYDSDGVVMMKDGKPIPLSVAKATNQQVSVLLDVLYDIAGNNGFDLGDRQ